MKLVQIIVTIILVNYHSSNFFLKEDHKLNEFNVSRFHKKRYDSKEGGVSYKTVLVKPVNYVYICPDQREVCGEDYKNYSDRCSIPQDIKIVSIGRCPYNSVPRFSKTNQREVVFDDYDY